MNVIKTNFNIDGVKFAKLNKNNTLKEYKDQVKSGKFYLENVKVMQIISLDQHEYDVASDRFLYDHDPNVLGAYAGSGDNNWTPNYKKIGGSEYDGPIDKIRQDIDHCNDYKEFMDYQEDVLMNEMFVNPDTGKEELGFDHFKNNLRTLVSMVINEETGSVFYVNTEGYNYARYVGI